MVLKLKYIIFGFLSIIILCGFFKYRESFEANTMDGRPFTYKGLFTDSSSRDLPKMGGKVNEENTFADAAKCQVMCKDYKYFGLQYFGECWCGNSYGKHGEKKENGKRAKFNTKKATEGSDDYPIKETGKLYVKVGGVFGSKNKTLDCKPGVHTMTESKAYSTNSNCSAKDKCQVELNDKCQARIYMEDRCLSARGHYSWSKYINPGESITPNKYCSLTTESVKTKASTEYVVDGKDLKRGEWDGGGGTSLKECEEKARKADVDYFAHTPKVYGGYCKVLKPSVSNPDLTTNQGYGYKRYKRVDRAPQESAKPVDKAPIGEGKRQYGSWQNYVFENHAYRKK